MATRGIYLGNIFSPPNYLEDLRRNDELIYIGTSSHVPTEVDYKMESLRNFIIETNFESKTRIYALGDSCYAHKPTSARYSWEVIKATFSALHSKFWTRALTIIYLIGYIPFLLSLGTAWALWIKHGGNSSFPARSLTNLSVITVLTSLGVYYSVQTLRSEIEQDLKPYLDGFVAFNKISYLPNSMSGFDLDQLANKKREDGWDDPISFDTITPDQISSTRILRIDKYAISITSAL
ncbi:MAG TPA: hypothetical protein VIJ14_01450, partial [Rhabdochlamydiaceae bacterium]